MDTALINALLTGGGTAVAVLGAIVVLFVTGRIFPKGVVDDLKAENAELKRAVAAKDATAGTSVAVTAATKDILAAIQLGRDLGQPHGHPPEPVP